MPTSPATPTSPSTPPSALLASSSSIPAPTSRKLPLCPSLLPWGRISNSSASASLPPMPLPPSSPTTAMRSSRSPSFGRPAHPWTSPIPPSSTSSTPPASPSSSPMTSQTAASAPPPRGHPARLSPTCTASTFHLPSLLAPIASTSASTTPSPAGASPWTHHIPRVASSLRSAWNSCPSRAPLCHRLCALLILRQRLARSLKRAHLVHRDCYASYRTTASASPTKPSRRCDAAAVAHGCRAPCLWDARLPPRLATVVVGRGLQHRHHCRRPAGANPDRARGHLPAPVLLATHGHGPEWTGPVPHAVPVRALWHARRASARP